MSENSTKTGRGGASLRETTDKLTVNQAVWVSCLSIVLCFVISAVLAVGFGILYFQLPLALLGVTPYAYLAASPNPRSE